METKTINLRDVPEELVRKAKVYAALHGLTLKDFILRSLQQALSAAEGELSAASLFAAPKPSIRARKTRKK